MKLSIVTTPNRFGFAQGSVWDWYRDYVLKGCDYEIVDGSKPHTISGDRVVLSGAVPMRLLSPDLNIFQSRGTIYQYRNKPAIVTFDLQEAYDFKSSTEDKGKEDPFSKDRAKTQHSNWLFWIRADTAKILRPILGTPSVPKVLIRPNLTAYTKHLLGTKDKVVYLDIETDIQSDTLDCIGLYIEGDNNVVVVPIYNPNGTLAYDHLSVLKYLAALSYVLRNNRCVIHNAMFDLLYLASHYRVTFGADIFDTMVVQKRCYPEVEKSLGHAISLWTDQPYHKDEHAANRSRESAERLFHYNAKDIWSMRLVYKAQLLHISKDKGLADSAAQANASVYPYLLSCLKGLRVDVSKWAGLKIAKDRRIVQIRRIIQLLIGDAKFNPDSPAQLVKYFHDKLGYKVVAWTNTGAPSLGATALYDLALKYPNPLIQVIIYYRHLVKARSNLNFNNLIYPWQSL